MPGYICLKSGTCRQCVVARLPSRSPAAARTNAPEQIDRQRAPLSDAREIDSSSRSGGRMPRSRQPGTTIVRALSRIDRSGDASTTIPPAARTLAPSADTTRKSYHVKSNSGRGKPNTSTAMPNSNVHRRSYATTATRPGPSAPDDSAWPAIWRDLTDLCQLRHCSHDPVAGNTGALVNQELPEHAYTRHRNTCCAT